MKSKCSLVKIVFPVVVLFLLFLLVSVLSSYFANNDGKLKMESFNSSTISDAVAQFHLSAGSYYLKLKGNSEYEFVFQMESGHSKISLNNYLEIGDSLFKDSFDTELIVKKSNGETQSFMLNDNYFGTPKN